MFLWLDYSSVKSLGCHVRRNIFLCIRCCTLWSKICYLSSTRCRRPSTVKTGRAFGPFGTTEACCVCLQRE